MPLIFDLSNILLNGRELKMSEVVLGMIHVFSFSSHFPLSALPVNGTLSATHNNADLSGGTLTNQADVQVGETVEFTCSAKIGSDNTTTVRWRRTSEIDTSDILLPYSPPFGSHSDGNLVYHPNNCTYSRDATMTYNVTSFDANRANNLAFQCYVTVVPPGQTAYEVASHAFYINPGKYL